MQFWYQCGAEFKIVTSEEGGGTNSHKLCLYRITCFLDRQIHFYFDCKFTVTVQNVDKLHYVYRIIGFCGCQIHFRYYFHSKFKVVAHEEDAGPNFDELHHL